MFFVNVTATTRIYTFRRTLSRPDALPILSQAAITGNGTLSTEGAVGRLDNTKSPITAEQVREWCATAGTILIRPVIDVAGHEPTGAYERSEEHTSELQSLMRTSYDVFCLKIKTKHTSSLRKHSSSR